MNVLIPVGIGELYDKISILEIKSEKVTDPEKLVHVHKELALLKDAAAKFPVDSTLYAELKDVNDQLWEIEIDIRAEEANKRFGEAFIRLAWSVSTLNDRRAEIKRTINLASGSDIVEVKQHTR